MILLLVNDIVVEAETMKAEIPWMNYQIDEVLTAYSAEEAKKVIRQNAVDVLLCDIEMPGENGLSLIHWVQQNHYNIDCILLTCHADFSYAREGLTLGCQDYLLLPAKYDDIGASVLKVVQRRIKRHEDERLLNYGKTWLQNQSDAIIPSDTTIHKTSAETADACIDYILSHIDDENLSVNDIAAHLYLNPIHLNRLFKKEKGINLSQWMIRERMTLASTLLRTTNHTAVDIATRVGYNNYPYFSTVFKKYFGCTPSQYVTEQKRSQSAPE